VAAGIGALVFVGLDNWTGLGTLSLALTSAPPAVPPRLPDTPINAQLPKPSYGYASELAPGVPVGNW
jgi:hypothetical protein